MLEHPRITLAPEVLAGKPLIRGTRLSVEFVIGLLADGQSEVDILENYPGITHEDIIVSRLPAASLSDRTSGQMRERNSCTQSIPCAEAS